MKHCWGVVLGMALSIIATLVMAESKPLPGVSGQPTVWLDVRSPEEYAEQHVDGAVNIPHDRIENFSELGLAFSAPIIVYCRSGRRSAIAEDALREMGYSNITNVKTLEAAEALFAQSDENTQATVD